VNSPKCFQKRVVDPSIALKRLAGHHALLACCC